DFAGLFDEMAMREDEGTLTEDLMARLQEKGARLLKTAFVSLGIDDPAEQINGMTITIERLTRTMVTFLQGMCSALGMQRSRIFLQDYRESFFYHTLFQKPELRQRNVGFFRFCGRKVTFYSMGIDNLVRPATARIEEGITVRLSESRSSWDEQFYNMVNASLRQNLYSSVFITGETFDRSWASRSVTLLCKGGRKAFVVDNLFARGACHAAREKIGENWLTDVMYLGDDLVRGSIGMDMLIQGRETYYPLISAGVNWYETDKVCECILTGKPELIFRVVSGRDGKEQYTRMQLPGMPERPPKTTRVRLHLYYSEPGECMIEVQDLGFGEWYPSSGKTWRDSWEDRK
ncbi:MAG: hypothetical protein HUJ73_08680, partial [Eubacterium sp.]|nr:hypothetical protein [Eubacterium sp.]